MAVRWVGGRGIGSLMIQHAVTLQLFQYASLRIWPRALARLAHFERNATQYPNGVTDLTKTSTYFSSSYGVRALTFLPVGWTSLSMILMWRLRWDSDTYGRFFAAICTYFS